MGSIGAVDIRNYITSGTTFDLAAVVAAMEAGNGECFIPPGDWTPVALNIALNETAVVGTGSAQARFTYKFVGSGKQSRLMLPSSMTSTDYLFIANSTNAATFRTHPKIVLVDFAVSGAAVGGVGNFMLANQRSLTAKRLYLSNMFNGFITTGYADLVRIEQVYAESMTVNGWAFTGTDNGDGLVIDQLFINGTGGINLQGCLGASVRGCIGGYHQFTSCAVDFHENHLEGDQYTGPIPTVTLTGCVADIYSGFYQAKTYRPTFSISDNSSTLFSRVTFHEGVWFGQRLDDTTSAYGAAKGVDVDIVSLSHQSEVRFKDCQSYIFLQSTAQGAGGSGTVGELAPLVTASGMSAIQTVLTASPVRLATDSTIRYVGSGAWEIAPSNQLPIPTKAIATTYLSGVAASSAYVTTDGSVGTWYYKAWVLDIAGRTTNPSAEVSVTTTSGSPLAQLTFNAEDAPVQLLLVRGTTSGTYTYWVALTVAEMTQTMYDQGSYINGGAWSSSGVPTVPTASGSYGQTADGCVFTSTGSAEIRATAAPTVGSWIVGDRCWNTSPTSGPPGWVCTVAGSPGTWVAVADVSSAQTLTKKTLTTPVINGITTGTGVASAATASTLALRDASGNLRANALVPSSTSTTTAAGPTTLSTQVQIFTGSMTQTAALPSTGIVAGQSFTIINQSTGAVTINASSGGNVSTANGANICVVVTALQATPTLPTHWASTYLTLFVPASSPLSTSIALRTPEGNLRVNAVIPSLTSTATAAGMTPLLVTSTETQVFTGSTTQTITLPTTSVIPGQQYRFINQSTDSLTVKSSGGGLVATVTAAGWATVVALVATPTTAANWAVKVTA